MAGTRALFASIGASAALVAAAALSLLALSAIFAFGGWSAPDSPFAEQPALVVAQSGLAAAGGSGTASGTSPVVAPAPARRAERRESTRPSARRAAPAPRPATASVSTGYPRVKPHVHKWPPTDSPTVSPAAPKTGDHVRKVGDSLSSTVEGTGAALATVTEPLAPPVSAAVQQVLNLVAEIVNRATEELGGGLDTLLAPK